MQSRLGQAIQLLISDVGDKPNIVAGSPDNNVPNRCKRRKKIVNCLYCHHQGEGQWTVDRHTVNLRKTFIPDSIDLRY
jgi:hypothetical protein